MCALHIEKNLIELTFLFFLYRDFSAAICSSSLDDIFCYYVARHWTILVNLLYCCVQEINMTYFAAMQLVIGRY